MIDYLILGGGSAGCVLAARLSEQAGKRVCLVEAGRDISAATMPAEVRSRYPGRAYLDPRNLWQRLVATYGANLQKPRRYEQARLLGGGSAINALMTNRGAPADYDEWERLGAGGWNWQACLPYFIELEHDTDLGGPLHGGQGPLRIRRTPPERLSPFVQGVMAALARRGHSIRADQNGPWEDGVFVGAIGVSEQGERIPTSVCYLTDTVRQRPNLEVRTGWQADRVLFDGSRARGAVLVNERGETQQLQAREVILCAGAIHSPAILMRSGVGPRAMLEGLGIEVVAAREGVGARLMEHPSIAVSTVLSRRGRTAHPAEHHEQAVWRYSSGLPGIGPGDMHGAILSRSGWHSVGYRMGTVFFWVNKSCSQGQVRLVSASPLVEPEVDFAMLSDERDLQRLMQALRYGAQVLQAEELAPLRSVVFPASYSPRVAKVAQPGLMNALARGALSVLLDIAGPLRGGLVRRVITQGAELRTLLSDERALAQFVRRNVGGTWHASCTCAMGATDDPTAVTDSAGRVIGTQGLRVCDASLMPSIPCANLNVPTIMIAERIAAMIAGTDQTR